MQALSNYTPPSMDQFGRDVYTDINGLKDINTLADKDQDAALKKMAQQFEGLFIQMMLKTMREANSVFADEQSSEMDFHQSLFDNQLALTMSSGRGIGLADSFYQQMIARYSETKAENRILSAPRAMAFNSMTSVPNKPLAVPKDPRTFVDYLYPHAERAGKAIGVEPEVLLAQSALETGWGQHVVADKTGVSSHNFFNIKADHRWQGEKVNKQTIEFRDGIAVRENANFRRYRSIADSFNDYAQFILTEPRYQSAREATSNTDYIQALHQSGYATDPEYANKIIELLQHEAIQSSHSRVGDR